MCVYDFNIYIYIYRSLEENKNNRIWRAVRRWKQRTHIHTYIQKLHVWEYENQIYSKLHKYLPAKAAFRSSFSFLLLSLHVFRGGEFYLIKYTMGPSPPQPQPPPPSLFCSFTSRYFPIVYIFVHIHNSRRRRRRRRKFNITRARFAEHVQQTPPRAHRRYIRYWLTTVYILWVYVPAHRIFGTRRFDCTVCCSTDMSYNIKHYVIFKILK